MKEQKRRTEHKESVPKRIRNFLNSEPTPEQLQNVLFWAAAITTIPIVIEIVRLLAEPR